MTETEAARMIEGIVGWDRCIVIYPATDADGAHPDQSGIRFIGMSAERAARFLYHAADEVLRQRVPLKPMGKPN